MLVGATNRVLSFGLGTICILSTGCGFNSMKTAVAHEVGIYRPITPLKSEIAGDWLGTTEDYLYIFRLSLEEKGTGSLAYSFAQDTPQALPVTGWLLDQRRILITVD